MSNITDQQIDAIAESMPDGLQGFCKGWGWRQFAREVLKLSDATGLIDAQVEFSRAEESRKRWRDRALKAETEVREAWVDFAELQTEAHNLRQQLKAAQDDVKQLRAARDKRVGKQDDGWIECRYLPINQWCDVKRADGTTDRVCRPEVRGVQQAAEITHYRPVKKEAKPKQDDGWIEWRGGECPVPEWVEVEYKTRSGGTGEQRARHLRWSKLGLDGDIIAYRLAK